MPIRTKIALAVQVLCVGAIFFFALIHAPDLGIGALLVLIAVGIAMFFALLHFMTVVDRLDNTTYRLETALYRNGELRRDVNDETDPFILAAVEEAMRTGKPVASLVVNPTDLSKPMTPIKNEVCVECGNPIEGGGLWTARPPYGIVHDDCLLDFGERMNMNEKVYDQDNWNEGCGQFTDDGPCDREPNHHGNCQP